MKKIKRAIESSIESEFFLGKAIIIYGPRQIGKSTMVESILGRLGMEYKYFNGDEADAQEILSNTTSTQLRALMGGSKVIFIDEAQRVKNIGITIKLLTSAF